MLRQAGVEGHRARRSAALMLCQKQEVAMLIPSTSMNGPPPACAPSVPPCFPSHPRRAASIDRRARAESLVSSIVTDCPAIAERTTWSSPSAPLSIITTSTTSSVPIFSLPDKADIRPTAGTPSFAQTNRQRQADRHVWPIGLAEGFMRPPRCCACSRSRLRQGALQLLMPLSMATGAMIRPADLR